MAWRLPRAGTRVSNLNKCACAGAEEQNGPGVRGGAGKIVLTRLQFGY